MKKYKVLFCDLDGTLIDTVSGKTFPQGIWDMKLKFDVLDAIKTLAPKYVFIVSNQGGIEDGYVDSNNFWDKMSYIETAISEYLSSIRTCVSSEYCETHNKYSSFRKPNCGMLIKLCNEFRQDYNKDCFIKDNMLMIGDASGLEGQFSDTDKKTAENFGIDYLDVNEFVKLYGDES